MNLTYALCAGFLDWFTEVNLLPNWVWCVIGAVVLIAVVVLIIVLVHKSKKKKRLAKAKAAAEAALLEEENEKASDTAESVESAPVEDAEPVKAEEAETEEVKAEDEAKSEEVSASAEEPKKKVAKKVVAKPADRYEAGNAKVVMAKPLDDSVIVEETASAAEKEETAKAKPTTKTYHISKRKDDDKWQVKAAGGAKAVKLFSTQAEAIDYAKKLAENQDANIIIHKVDGSFRKLKY